MRFSKRDRINLAVEHTRTREQEAIKRGLPSRADIMAQIDTIASGMQFSFFGEDKVIPERADITEFTEAKYEQYLSEFDDDVDVFNVRIQRLKLRLLQYTFRGTADHVAHEGIDSWKKDTLVPERRPHDAFKQLVSAINNDTVELNPTTGRDLLELARRCLGGEVLLFKPETITKKDIDLLEDVVDKSDYPRSMDPAEAAQLEAMLGQIHDIESTIIDVQKQGELFQTEENRAIGEEKFRKLWKQYRRLIKQFATFLEQDNWFAPTYGSSIDGQKGKEQFVDPFLTDYQRNKMREIEEVERVLVREYYGKDPNKMDATIVNSGMAALQLILQEVYEQRGYTKEDQRPEMTIVRTDNLYFEVENMVDRFAKRYDIKEEVIRGMDTAALIEAVKRVPPPEMVVIEPLANSFEMNTVDVIAFLDALQSDTAWQDQVVEHQRRSQKMRIIIDNTTLGNAAAWLDYDVSKLPTFVELVGFESLAKYVQDGQDVTQGGVIFSFRSQFFGSGFEQANSARRTKGGMPVEAVARRIENTIYGDVLKKNMERRSRNTAFIGERLAAARDAVAQEFPSIITDIVYPGSPDQASPHDQSHIQKSTGGLLNIGFNIDRIVHEPLTAISKKRYGTSIKDDMKYVAQVFSTIVMKLAKKHGVDIHKGSSYGFHTTRFAIYEKRLPEDEHIHFEGQPYSTIRLVPYIWVAVGTEHIKDATLIAEIFAQANYLISYALANDTFFELSNIATDRNHEF